MHTVNGAMSKKRTAALFGQPTKATSALLNVDQADDDEDRALIPEPLLGYVDIFGYSSAAGGWLFNGWIPRPLDLDQAHGVELVAHFEQSRCSGHATLAFYRREDLDQSAVGVIALLPSSSRVLGPLQHIDFSIEGKAFQARTGDFTTRLLDQEIVERVRLNLLHQAIAGRSREHLLQITARRGYAGHDTLPSLTEPVLMEIDDAIFCPPAGVLLKGWLLASAGTVRNLRVRSGPLAGEVMRELAIRVDRPDVIAAVGLEHGFSELRCGFVAYVPGVVSSGDALYLEVELENGEVGFKPLKLSKCVGIDAIKRVLQGVEVRFGEIDSIFDVTLGPAISSLNEARLSEPPLVEELQFGTAPQNPVCTLIIPLYGRVDFLEYQMAIFSRQSRSPAVEILYVLDDPGKQRELEVLSQSTYERFQIPFRLLLLQDNVGFAPANNVGLQAANGEFVCFLNSDAFPISPDWVGSLIAGLERNPDIAIIGARLLFEDGSIQHEGCHYNPLIEFGNWQFIDHVNKGRRPVRSTDIHRHAAVTGACMMMSRSHAEQMGGFDEAFIVGDFEDSDLCLKTRKHGLACAVHADVEMYHLERKSQASPGESWRMNLTLYNAWVHQRRWFGTQAPADGAVTQAVS
jgi:GT2 family glycosyltransferase